MNTPAPNNVFHIAPRKVHGEHHHVPYVISYDPATKKWHWEALYTVSLPATGVTDTEEKARAACERRIDELLGN